MIVRAPNLSLLRFPTEILGRKARIFVDFVLNQFVDIRLRRTEVDVVAAGSKIFLKLRFLHAFSDRIRQNFRRCFWQAFGCQECDAREQIDLA
jgi:hypothetical protein